MLIINQAIVDDKNNIGIAIHPQAGHVRRIPLMTASLNIDENGNIGAFLDSDNDGNACHCQAMTDEEVDFLIQKIKQ